MKECFSNVCVCETSMRFEMLVIFGSRQQLINIFAKFWNLLSISVASRTTDVN